MDGASKDDLLAGALDCLGNNAGLRRANIQSLWESLTIQERRELKAKVDSLDFSTDVLARLPLELQLLIAEQVDSADIFSFIGVSRTWRHIWLGETFVTKLSAIAFPGMLNETASDSDRMEVDSTHRRTQLLIRAARQVHRRCKGIVRSVMCHSFWLETDGYFKLDPSLHPDQSYASIMRSLPLPQHAAVYMTSYRDGKLAWQSDSHRPPDDSLIVVDDLRRRSRRVYKVEGLLLHGRPQALLSALGDKLVVAVSDRTVHVWNLESGGLESIEVPSNIDLCVTEGLSVGISSATRSDPHAYIYTFGGPLLELDLSKPMSILEDLVPNRSGFSHGRVQAMLLHPTRPDVCYVITAAETWRASKYRSVCVHEYVQGEYESSRIHNLRLRPGLHGMSSAGFNDGVHVERLGPHGLYKITSTWFLEQDSVLGIHSRLFSVVAFNVFTGSFTTHEFRVPLTNCVNARHINPFTCLHLWRGQLALWMDGCKSHSPEDVRSINLPVIIFTQLSESQSEAADHVLQEAAANRYTASVTDVPNTTWTKFVQYVRERTSYGQNERFSSNTDLQTCLGSVMPFSPVSHVLELPSTKSAQSAKQPAAKSVRHLWGMVTGDHDPEHEQVTYQDPGNLAGQRIYGDDDLLIFINSGGYVAWSFDTPLGPGDKSRDWWQGARINLYTNA